MECFHLFLFSVARKDIWFREAAQLKMKICILKDRKKRKKKWNLLFSLLPSVVVFLKRLTVRGSRKNETVKVGGDFQHPVQPLTSSLFLCVRVFRAKRKEERKQRPSNRRLRCDAAKSNGMGDGWQCSFNFHTRWLLYNLLRPAHDYHHLLTSLRILCINLYRCC
jgi:hypothetical protein